jgi:hypothetical protein
MQGKEANLHQYKFSRNRGQGRVLCTIRLTTSVLLKLVILYRSFTEARLQVLYVSHLIQPGSKTFESVFLDFLPKGITLAILDRQLFNEYMN